MNGRGLSAVLLAAGLALSGCGAGDADAPRTGSGATPAPLGTLTSGDPLPEASFPVLGGDEVVSTADFRGTPTIVNFWATWCTFCIEEMPDLELAHQELGDAVRFVGIDRQDNTQKALELAAETGVTYLLLESKDGTYFERIRGRGMPTTLFVDGEGTIRHRHAGPITADEVLELAEEKLGVER